MKLLFECVNLPADEPKRWTYLDRLLTLKLATTGRTERHEIKYHDEGELRASFLTHFDVNPGEGSFSRTPSSLLAAAQRADKDAWHRLVREYSRSIYRWCRRAGLQPADAGNIVQEVFRAVARKLPDFRREQAGDTFRGWLRRITQNKLRDHFRNQAKSVDRPLGGTDAHDMIVRLAAPSETTATSVTGAAIDDGLSARQRGAIEQVKVEFSERDWRFFWRVVVDGQSAVEVGAEFGVTANTVRLVKMRILKRLRTLAGAE